MELDVTNSTCPWNGGAGARTERMRIDERDQVRPGGGGNSDGGN